MYWRVATWQTGRTRVSWAGYRTRTEAGIDATRISRDGACFTAVYHEDTDGELVMREAYNNGNPVSLTEANEILTAKGVM